MWSREGHLPETLKGLEQPEFWLLATEKPGADGGCLSACHCKRDVEWDSEGPALSSYVWLVASLGTFAALREREREREAIEVALQE